MLRNLTRYPDGGAHWRNRLTEGLEQNNSP
jgi:hypothetical protein